MKIEAPRDALGKMLGDHFILTNIQDDSVCLISWIFFLVHFPDFPSVIVFTFPPAGQRTYLHHFKPLAPLRHGSRLLIDPLQHVDQLLVALVALGLLLQELLVLLAALVAHRLVAGVQTHIRLPFFFGQDGGGIKKLLTAQCASARFYPTCAPAAGDYPRCTKEKGCGEESQVKGHEYHL